MVAGYGLPLGGRQLYIILYRDAGRAGLRSVHELSKNPRSTRFIRPSQAKNILAACSHAEKIGCPLNTHVTIHWVGTVDMASRVPDRIQRLIERLRHWLRRREAEICHVWAQEPSKRRFENSDVPHLHMLIHIPPEHRLAFDVQIREWVGGVSDDRAIKIESVIARTWRWQNYLLKGVNPNTRDEMLQKLSGHKKAREARGPVEGKRCGISQNTLGPAARAKWEKRQAQQLKRKA